MKLTQALALITVTTGLGIAGTITLPGNTTQAATLGCPLAPSLGESSQPFSHSTSFTR